MSLVTVGMNYQVIIPDEVREQMPVAVGDPLEVTFQDGAILLRPTSDAARLASASKLLSGFRNPLPADCEFTHMTEDEIMELAMDEIAQMRAEQPVGNGQKRETGH
ncbi:MAG: AbrB/MazE/SpoVT family DNA-binding domain-containing protein [Magnetococcales bacterium]|nr:AbrB/MazE/SpoVT family DNA-binding domain-containing protein [Magnetococcales bacterium]NGZ25778.1 AbrB/MazE/SpoVT family DNA-binding domain-containing protein [Magnetococcales bacterium]